LATLLCLLLVIEKVFLLYLNKKQRYELQWIWAIDLMENWFCIWDELANPNNGINLVPNPL
jgi:hypothetical protein